MGYGYRTPRKLLWVLRPMGRVPKPSHNQPGLEVWATIGYGQLLRKELDTRSPKIISQPQMGQSTDALNIFCWMDCNMLNDWHGIPPTLTNDFAAGDRLATQ